MEYFDAIIGVWKLAGMIFLTGFLFGCGFHLANRLVQGKYANIYITKEQPK